MGNTIKGVSPKFSRQVVIACILLNAHFGAEIWWPGKSRIKGNRTIWNRVGISILNAQKLHPATAWKILPVFWTTPTKSPFREVAILLAEVTLDITAQKAAIRTRRLNPRHLLCFRGENLLSQPALSHFSRTCRNINISDYFCPLANPLCETIESRQDALNHIGGPSGSIGIRTTDGNSARGFVIFQFGIRMCSGTFLLGKYKSPCDAEAPLHAFRTMHRSS